MCKLEETEVLNDEMPKCVAETDTMMETRVLSHS